MNDLPTLLIDNIKNKNIVLFLGSGFAYNAVHPEQKQAPLGAKLAELISDKFLGGEFKDDALTHVSDLAISQSSLFDVQNFIADLFEKFSPNKNHKIYTTLPWKAIFTTNYDTILEKAYSENNKKNAQHISTVFRNTPEQQVFKTPNTVPYYKLHGCITYINDENLPLILSTEQYLTHRQNRDRLFKKLEELSLDYSILFIGYSNQDHNIRYILKQLEAIKEGRPRSFMVKPNFSEVEKGYWHQRKITPLSYGHEEFINLVNERISKTDIDLAKLRIAVDRKIYNHFVVDIKVLVPTESLNNFLDYESEYVHSNLKLGNTTPKAFYKGFFNNWDPIIKNLDVRRNLETRILTDLVFEDEFQAESKSFLFLIKGFGGAGKTVLLRRIAWEAAVEFEKLVIFIKPNQTLRHEPIIELYNYAKERIYIFIDNTIENQASIIELLKKANFEKIPITIVTSERKNLLNERSLIDVYLTKDYALTYLTNDEIDKLILKLEEHKSLGYLENKSKEQRRKELEERSGRELLVALYEATGGKPFEDIILDEYNSITTEDAKSVYVTVAVFHRLGTKVRAGLISRIHNISFNDFKDRLFSPLEFIIFNERDYFINDYVYTTRHPFIAEIIFEQVLKKEQDRYDEYVRVLHNIDIDYKSDWSAFLDITNARKLNSIFNDPIRVRNIYDLAEKINPSDPKLLQQKGIYQMVANSGNLHSAQKLLKEANKKSPKDILISHSLAEVSVRKAEKARNEVEKFRHLETAEKLCKQIIKSNKSHSYSYHTLLKISLLKFLHAIKKEISSVIETRVKEFEQIMSEAKQLFPRQEFILEIEAKFNEIIKDEPKAIKILEKAFENNKASPFLAIRYANLLSKNNQLEKAISALQGTIELNPNDRSVNYQLATLIRKHEPLNYKANMYLYRRAFTKGDTRYEAQFWYARSAYLLGEFEIAKEIFNDLSVAKLPLYSKNETRGIVKSINGLELYSGVIIKQENSYAFIRRNKFGDDIFLHRNSSIKNWQNYRIGTNVQFNLAFNYKGANSINTKLENVLIEK